MCDKKMYYRRKVEKDWHIFNLYKNISLGENKDDRSIL